MPVLAEGYYNGKLYGIPNGNNKSFVLGYRSDWLKRLKLEEPTDWEAFCEMLRAFTYDDPDGNGKDDTVGLCMNTEERSWDAMEAWFGVPNEWGIDEGGNLIHKTRTPEYRKAYAAFRQLYEQGLMNNGINGVKEFRQNDESYTMLKGGLLNENCGSVIISPDTLNNQHAHIVRTEDEPHLYSMLPYVDTGLGPLCYTAQGLYGDEHVGKYYGMLAISTRRIQTTEQLQQVLQCLNDLHSPECMTLIEHGMEGVNYYYDEEGVWRPIYTKLDVYGVKASVQWTCPNFEHVLFETLRLQNNQIPIKYSPGTLLESVEIGEVTAEYSVPNYGQQFPSPTDKEKGAELDKMLLEAEWKYVAGELDDAGFEAALNAWWEDGGEAITGELNEKYHAAGY